MRKHGIENFTFRVVSTHATEVEAYVGERQRELQLKSEGVKLYNMIPCGRGRQSGWKHQKRTKKSIGRSVSKRWKDPVFHSKQKRKGSDNSRAVVTEQDVLSLRSLWETEPDALSAGEFYRHHAPRLGVNPQTIQQIITRRLWPHIVPQGAPPPRKRSRKRQDNSYLDDPAFRERTMKTKPRGEKHSQAKVTEGDVIELRREYDAVKEWKFGERMLFYRKWAKKLGTTPTQATYIAHRKSWKHLP